ncbi:hypothetical protein TNCV_2267221 [Trichonephila clavipes]|nr:hypothetical protein TNCV_2267221 [Trichonephila clavipes]
MGIEHCLVADLGKYPYGGKIAPPFDLKRSINLSTVERFSELDARNRRRASLNAMCCLHFNSIICFSAKNEEQREKFAGDDYPYSLYSSHLQCTLLSEKPIDFCGKKKVIPVSEATD